jgi:toxin FitB
MFLLDTNVISELRRPERADRNVAAWASAIPAASFFLSTISILEIELGALQIAPKDVAQIAVLRAWRNLNRSRSDGCDPQRRRLRVHGRSTV